MFEISDSWLEAQLLNVRRRHVDTVPNMAQAVLRQRN